MAARLFPGTRHAMIAATSRGPLLLVDDVLDQPVIYRDGGLHLPEGLGLGVSLNRAKLEQVAGDLP
ncbi:MAG: hypothetical protein HY332_00110 [Chloroflexi bacterium]|nr:hypothetical protein [Chloroflexota bacterium]